MAYAMEDVDMLDLPFESPAHYSPAQQQLQQQQQHQKDDFFDSYRLDVDNEMSFAPQTSNQSMDTHQWDQENEENIRRRVLFEADQALTQLEVCYSTAERWLPSILGPRQDGSPGHLILARHHLRQTIADDLQTMLFPQSLSNSTSLGSSGSLSLSRTNNESSLFSSPSSSSSSSARVSHSALTPGMSDLTVDSSSQLDDMMMTGFGGTKKRARATPSASAADDFMSDKMNITSSPVLATNQRQGGGGGGGGQNGNGNNNNKRSTYDAQSVRAGKVPAALTNTSAPTMIYTFDLKNKGKRARRKGTAASTDGTGAGGSGGGLTSSLGFSNGGGSGGGGGGKELASGLPDFDILNVLGVGTYGTVRLCRHRPSQQTYCVKVLSRQLIYKHKQTEHLKNEKNVLLAVNHTGIVKCIATGHDHASLFLVLEYVPGGELFQYIRRLGRLTVPAAKFYAAEILITLDYLHSRGIVYRDLKPENILLDELGHSKLTDFGFAKIIYSERTWTMCGTPDYIAPEVIACTGHGIAVDWWSYGVLMFEMLAGYPPFTDPNTLALFSKIKEPQNIKYPQTLSSDVIDLIQRILVVDPARRLGALAAGAQDIANHPWFYGVNWRVVSERTIAGPIRPVLRSADDFPRGGPNDAYDANKDAVTGSSSALPPEVQHFFDSF